jgi:hypothetical protein
MGSKPKLAGDSRGLKVKLKIEVDPINTVRWGKIVLTSGENDWAERVFHDVDFSSGMGVRIRLPAFRA